MGHDPGQPVKTRGRPHGQGGRRRSSSSSTPHLMGSGPGRPVKTYRPPHGPGGAAHIEPTSHGPRPGPAYQISRGWAATRPGPSIFQFFTARPGPSDFQKSRPGPAHHIFKSLGPARHNFQIDPARHGPDKRPMTSPGYYGVVAVLRLVVLLLLLLCSCARRN